MAVRISAVLLLLGSLLLAAPAARAIPAPMPPDRLEAMASDVVEGEVIKVTFLRSGRNGPYAFAVYEAELRVGKVTKGKLAPGRVIVIGFSTESWVGPGQQPPGRSPQPAYYPCEQVRAWLQAGKEGRYFTAAWNGRQGLRAPGAYRLPDPPAKVLRCVAGQVR